MKRNDAPEDIELHSYCISSKNDSDIEEYHEINEPSNQEATSSLYSTKTLKEYDFFTQNDVPIEEKSNGKKKKSKKKGKSENLMDIISSELASDAVPIKENAVTIVNNIKKQQTSCLAKVSLLQNLFGNRRPLRTDFEYRWRSARPVDLSPIFPRVLENATIKDIDIPVQYVEPTMFKEFIANNVNVDIQTVPKFLDIELKNIQFKHHHTFHLENLLCVKLIEYYNEYEVTQKLLTDLLTETKVNRDTRDNLIQDLIKVSPHKKEDLRFDPTVRKYSEKLIQTKQKYFKTLQKKKELTHKVLSLWSDIEMVRDKFGFITTPYNLDITTETLEEKDFEKEWHKVFNTEFSDLLSKIEYDHVSKYIEYKEMKNDQTIEYSRRKRITKPKLEIHEDMLKEEVEQLVNTIVSKDQIDIKLKTDDSITVNPTILEKTNSLNNYCFKIFVDDVFVCESDNYIHENKSFLGLQFTELFSIQILPNNTSLMIVLFENNEQVSSLKKYLTEIKKCYANAESIVESFVYDKIVDPTPKYVGSGHSIREIAKENKMRLKSKNIFEGNLYTACDINIKIGWNEKLNHNQSENIKSSMEIGRKLKRLLHGTDKPNIDVLTDVIAKIYGKDVENDDKVITTLKNVCKTTIKTDDTFPIPDAKSSEFIRLNLLHLRNKGGFTNIENKLVPFHGSQISTDQLKCLQKSDGKEFDIEYIHSKHIDADPIELQRFVGAKYVQKLNKNMLKNLNEHLLKKTHKDVVRDFKDLSLRSFFSNNINLAALATISENTKQQLLNESLSKEQEIQITVLRAFNLLNRQEAIISEEVEDNDRIAGFNISQLRPFVRLTYHAATVQTTTAIGCHPTWNQTVKIKAKPDPLSSIYINVYDEYKANIREGHSADQSRTVHYRYYHKWLGMVQIPLYAVLTFGTLHGTFKISTPSLLFGYETTSLQTKEHSTHTLIPGVSQLMKKDTSFISLKLTTNLSHLGGLQAYNQPIPSGPDDDYLIKHLNNFVTAYVNDFPSRNISLTFIDSTGKNKCVTQFLQPIPLPDYDWLPKNQKNVGTGSAMSKSSGLSKSSSSKSSGGRRLDIDVEKGSINEERESLYSTREGSWRSGETQLTKMMNACLRYVALIPTYEVTESHVVTLSGLELLKVLHGSPLDHTILLASYFLYLGIKCWIAIGLGLPRGPSSFVLTKYDLTTNRVVLTNDQLFKRGLFNRNDGYLWNVYESTTGERFELRDVSCPLKSVDYVFDNENIWVNVQSSQDCENMTFDFEKSSNWQPVFDKMIFVMKQPIVTDSSLYSAPADVSKLRQSIEAKIRAKIHKWRPHMKTIWNRYCSGLLRELLPSWEYWSFNPSEPKPGFSQRLKQLLVTYKMFGFPLNNSYMNTKAVVASVKSTGVHVNEDPNAEFALAVELYAYPNNVISVWVFLACINRI